MDEENAAAKRAKGLHWLKATKTFLQRDVDPNLRIIDIPRISVDGSAYVVPSVLLEP